MPDCPRILAVRLGAMGDILHALPAVASLKHGIPHSQVTWVVEPKWADLLEGNPFVDRVLLLERTSLAGILAAGRQLRSNFDVAVDFQGLIKSALVASASRAQQIFGFHQSQIRERLAGLFYSNRTRARNSHVVDRNLELAASAGASSILRAFPLPQGRPEGNLPGQPFVLASPLAGWVSKQWPLEYYSAVAVRLRRDLGIPLVLNVPHADSLRDAVTGAMLHISGIAGLIDATRRAAAVIGVDSGPLHLAAALNKPGVAVFGPTDPARNGPYGGSIAVLRSPGAVTSYKRHETIDPSMRDVHPAAVLEALEKCMAARA
jgi:heptosyltransferase-1